MNLTAESRFSYSFGLDSKHKALEFARNNLKKPWFLISGVVRFEKGSAPNPRLCGSHHRMRGKSTSRPSQKSKISRYPL